MNSIFLGAGLFWGSLVSVSAELSFASDQEGILERILADLDRIQGLCIWGFVNNVQLRQSNNRVAPEIHSIAMGTSNFTAAEAVALVTALMDDYDTFTS